MGRHKLYPKDPLSDPEKHPLTAGLVYAIEQSGLTVAAISRRANLAQSRLYHLKDGRTLELWEADKLATALGLELTFTETGRNPCKVYPGDPDYQEALTKR